MSIEELKKSIEEMKAQGQSEEEIAGAFYLLFREGKIDLEQLEALVNVLGFELSEEFKAMDPEMQKEAGYEVLDENAGQKPEKNSEEEKQDQEDSGKEDEEEKAMKLLGQNKKEEKEETSEPEKNKEDEEKEAMKYLR